MKLGRYLFFILVFISNLFAYEYRAYGIAGDKLSSKSEISIKGEVYTLLPFSTIDISNTEMNKDGEYTVFVGKVNGIEVKPIKLASNYKNNHIVIKVFKSSTLFDESTFVGQSEEILANDSYKFYNINLK